MCDPGRKDSWGGSTTPNCWVQLLLLLLLAAACLTVCQQRAPLLPVCCGMCSSSSLHPSKAWTGLHTNKHAYSSTDTRRERSLNCSTCCRLSVKKAGKGGMYDRCWAVRAEEARRSLFEQAAWCC